MNRFGIITLALIAAASTTAPGMISKWIDSASAKPVPVVQAHARGALPRN